MYANDAKNFTALSCGVAVNLSIFQLARQRPEMREAPWSEAGGAPLSFSRARLGYRGYPRRFAQAHPFLRDAAGDPGRASVAVASPLHMPSHPHHGNAGRVWRSVQIALLDAQGAKGATK
jgi:hypothetical protein